MVSNSPRGSKFKIMFIQCSSCGTTVGVMDYFNIPTLIEEVKKTLQDIESENKSINNKIGMLHNLVQSKK